MSNIPQEPNMAGESPEAIQPQEIGSDMVSTENERWFRRHKLALAVSGFAVAGALTMTEFQQTVSSIEHDARWAVPALAVTEAAAWLGAGIMLVSSGRKIGNPFTVKKRLTETISQIEDSSAFRKGWTVNVAGAAGTSAVIAGGAVATLPPSSWPLAAGAASASLLFSGLPFKNIVRSNKRQDTER